MGEKDTQIFIEAMLLMFDHQSHMQNIRAEEAILDPEIKLSLLR
jgi:hypothetical protein